MVSRVKKLALHVMLVLPVFVVAAAKKLGDADKEIVYGILDKLGGVQRSCGELKTKLDAFQEDASRKNKDSAASKVIDDKNQPSQVASPGTTLALAVAAVSPAQAVVLPAQTTPLITPDPAITTVPAVAVGTAAAVVSDEKKNEPVLPAVAGIAPAAAPTMTVPVATEPVMSVADSSVALVAAAPSVPAQGFSPAVVLPVLPAVSEIPVASAPVAPAPVAVPATPTPPEASAAPVPSTAPALPALPELPPLPPLPPL